MVKYTGPRLKILKNLYLSNLQSFSNKKNLIKKNIRAKKSSYFLDLKKRLIIKYYYNINNKQLNNYIKTVNKKIGFKNIELLILLEKRIDSILFQYYISKSISESRKLILEKKIFLNKKLIKNPSHLVNEGDIIICYNINCLEDYYNYHIKNNYYSLPKAIIVKKNYIKLIILRNTSPFELPVKLYI